MKRMKMTRKNKKYNGGKVNVENKTPLPFDISRGRQLTNADLIQDENRYQAEMARQNMQLELERRRNMQSIPTAVDNNNNTENAVTNEPNMLELLQMYGLPNNTPGVGGRKSIKKTKKQKTKKRKTKGRRCK